MDDSLRSNFGSTEIEKINMKTNSEVSWEGTDPCDEDEDATFTFDDEKIINDYDDWSAKTCDNKNHMKLNSDVRSPPSHRFTSDDNSSHSTSTYMAQTQDDFGMKSSDKFMNNESATIINLPSPSLVGINDDNQSYASSLASWLPITEDTMHQLQAQQGHHSLSDQPARREWMDVYRITEHDSGSDSNTVATSLVVEVESVNEDGSYVGYGGSSESDEDNVSNTTLDYVRLSVRRISSARHKKLSLVGIHSLETPGSTALVSGSSSIPGSVSGDADGYDGDAASDSHSDRGGTASRSSELGLIWNRGGGGTSSSNGDYDMCTDESESRCQSPSTSVSVSSSVCTVPTHVPPHSSHRRHQIYNKANLMHRSHYGPPITRTRIPWQGNLIHQNTTSNSSITSSEGTTRLQSKDNKHNTHHNTNNSNNNNNSISPSTLTPSLLEKRGLSWALSSPSPEPTISNFTSIFKGNTNNTNDQHHHKSISPASTTLSIGSHSRPLDRSLLESSPSSSSSSFTHFLQTDISRPFILHSSSASPTSLFVPANTATGSLVDGIQGSVLVPSMRADTPDIVSHHDSTESMDDSGIDNMNGRRVKRKYHSSKYKSS